MKTSKKSFPAFSCDELPLPVIIYSQHDGRVIQYNKEAKRIFGLPVKARMPLNIQKLRLEKLPTHSVRKSKGFDDFGPILHRTVKGKEISLVVLRKAMNWQNIDCFIDFFEDANEMLFLKNEIVKTSLDAFISIDENQIIQDWNASAEKIFGWKRKEVMGLKLTDIIVPKQHRERHSKGFKHYLKTGEERMLNKLVEISAIHKKGHEFPVELTITASRDQGRKLFYSIIRDISDRKKKEQNLQENEYKLNKAQAIASIGSWEMVGNFTELHWSDEFYRIHGLEPRSVKPSTKLRLSMIHPQDRAKMEKAINEAVRQGKPYAIEKRIVLKDGSVRWVLSQGEATIDPLTNRRKVFGTLLDITEKRKTETDLLAKGKDIKKMLEGITDGFFGVDRDLNFTLISPVFAKQANMTPDEMIGKNMLALFPHMEGGEPLNQYRKAIKTQQSSEKELQNILNPNQFFLIAAYPNQEGLFVHYKDISASIKAERELRNANELFRRLTANVPGMIYNFYLTDETKGVFPYVSSGSKSLVGIDAQELMKDANRLFQIVHPEDFEVVMQSIKDAFYSNKPWTHEFRLIMPDQSVKWVAGASNPYKESDGSNYWYGFMHDITERKLADQRIAESELKNRLIIENSGEGIMFTTPEGSIISANPEACRIFGMTEEEICKAGRNGIVDVSDPNLQMILKKQSDQGFYQGELRLRRKDGTVFQGEINSRRFIRPDGKANGSLIVRDISERKRAEQVREELLSRFEKIATHLPGFIYQYRLKKDGTSCFPYASKRIQDIYGVSIETAERDASEVFKAIHPDDLQHVSESIQASANELSEWRETYRVYTPGGKLIWLEGNASPQKLEDESILWSGYISDVTYRKTAEEALQKSEHDLRAILNASNDSAFFMDVNGNIRVANVKGIQSIKKLFGREFKIGDHFTALFPEQSGLRFRANFQKALAGQAVNLEPEIKIKDDSTIWVKANYLPVRDEAGNIIGVSFNAANITERKVTEQALKKSEERFKLLYNNTPGMMHSIDATGHLIRVSDYWLQKMEYTREEVLGRKSTDFLTEDSKQKANEIYLPEFFNTGTISNAEYQFVTKSGKILTALLSASSELDDAGTIVKSMAVVTDISDKRMLEQEVQKLGLMVSHTSNAIILTDVDGRITWVNDGFERLTEYKLSDIVGRDPGELLQGPETDRETIRLMDTALSTRQGFKVDILNYTKSGSKIWLDIEVMPVKNEAGIVTGFMAIESDITGLKNAILETQRTQRVLQTFMDYAPLVAFVKDANGRYTFYNKAYTDFIGTSALKSGCTDYDLFDKEFSDLCVTRDQHILTTGETLKFEHGIQNQIFLEYKFPLHDSQNKIFAVGGISIDITEKLEAQKLIAENEQRLRSITDHLSNGVIYQYLVNEKGEIESFPYISNGAFDLYEIPATEITRNPMAVFNLVHQDDLPEMMKVAELSRENLSPFDYEYRIVTPSGKVKWVHTRSTPRRTPDGKTLWDGLSVNTTTRKKLEIAVQASETKLQSIFQSMISGVVVVDVNGEFTYANQSAAEILSLEAEEIEHRFYSSKEWKQIDEQGNPFPLTELPLAVALQKKISVSNVEHGIKSGDDDVKWLNVSAAPLLDQNQNLVGAVASFLDVTERKNAQQELKKVHDELNAILNASSDVSIFFDPEYAVRVFNKTAEINIGNLFGKIISKGDNILNYIPTALVNDFKNNTKRALQGELVTIEREIRFTNSITQWSLIKYMPVHDKAGSVIGVSFNTTDISKGKQAEIELIKANRLYAVVSQVNDMVIHAKTTDEVYSEICRIAIEHGQFRMAWIGLVDRESQTIKPIVHSGFEDGYFQEIQEISILDVPAGRGPTGTAVREKRTVFNNNLANSDDVNFSLWREKALKRNYLSSIALPIIINDEAIGVFTLYKSEHFFFTDKEVTLLEEMASNISFSISTIQNEYDRHQKEAALKASEERFRAIAENMPGSIYQFLLKQDGTFSFPFFTDGIIKSVGLETDILKEGRLMEVIHPDDVPVFLDEMAKSANELSNFHHSVRVKNVKGGYSWLTGHSKPKRLPNGATLWEGVLLDDTDQKTAEEDFQRSQKRVQAIFDNTINGIILADDAGNYLEGNPAILNMLGYTHAEFTSLHVSQVAIVDSMKPDPFNEFLKAREQTGMIDLRTKNGTIITVRYNAVANILPGLHLSIIEDITERVKAERLLVEQAEEIKKKNEQFLSIAQNLPNGSIYQFVIKPNGNLEMPFFSDGLAKRLGTTGEAIMNDVMAFNSRCHPDDVALIQQAVFYSAEHLTDFRERLGRFKDNDGKYHHLGWYSKPSRLADGSTIWEGVVMDETEQREAEKNLQFSRFTIDHASDPIFWVKPDATFADINSAAYEFLGYTFDEMIRLSIPDIDSQYSEQAWPIFWQELREKKAINYETQQKRKDGTLVDVEINANYIQYEGQEFNCAFVRDITDRKKYETALITSNREKDVLIKEIHHRVKNNLQLISSVLYIRMASMPDSEIKSFLEDTRQKIRSIALIHERLLQSGSVNEIDIADYLGKLVLDLQMSHSHIGLQLQFITQFEPERIKLDTAIYCGLIVNELVTNSIKHAFGGRALGKIEISFQKSGSMYQLRVYDDGCSLPESVHIGQSGSFGMQMLDIFIKQLGGLVEVSRNGGTCFVITFRS